jgi:hypothetical protein
MLRSFLKSALALIVVFLSSYALEVMLHHDGVPSRYLLLASSLAVGAVAAALVYLLAVREQRRQAYVECRLRVIADMNHHIRNALQVITFYGHSGAKQQVSVAEAVLRIQWALKEVLPQLPESFDGESANCNSVQPVPSAPASAVNGSAVLQLTPHRSR